MAMTREEIRKMDDAGLLEEIDDKKEELQRLRFQLATGQLENPNLIRNTRREIARMRTILRERQIARELAAKEGGNA